MARQHGRRDALPSLLLQKVRDAVTLPSSSGMRLQRTHPPRQSSPNRVPSWDPVPARQQQRASRASEPPSVSWGRCAPRAVSQSGGTLCRLSRHGLRRGEAPGPRARCSNRTCHFTTFGRLLGDAQEGVGTRWAGPQEADRVCLGSLGWSAACWRHTPCVSLREARRTFLPCFLFSLPSGAGPRRCPEKTPPRTCLVGRHLPRAPGVLAIPLSPAPHAVCVNSFPSPQTPLMGSELIQQIFAEYPLPVKGCWMHRGHIREQSTWKSRACEPHILARETDRPENRRHA